MSHESRTAADFLWWMKNNGLSFRSGFSHLKFEEVVQLYVDHLKEVEHDEQGSSPCSDQPEQDAPEPRRRSASDDRSTHARQED